MNRTRSMGVVLCVWLAYLLLGHRYTNHWQSNRTLWTYAAQQTPMYPLAVVNSAVVNRP